MGRAVMVGRGPTGAGLPLVLPILIVLAARSCRAQKGWLVDSGANPNLTNMQPHGGPRAPPPLPSLPSFNGTVVLCCCLHVSVHCWGGKYGAVVFCRPIKTDGRKATLHGCSRGRGAPHGFTPPPPRHAGMFGAAKPGKPVLKEPRVSSAPRCGRLLAY